LAVLAVLTHIPRNILMLMFDMIVIEDIGNMLAL